MHFKRPRSYLALVLKNYKLIVMSHTRIGNVLIYWVTITMTATGGGNLEVNALYKNRYLQSGAHFCSLRTKILNIIHVYRIFNQITDFL